MNTTIQIRIDQKTKDKAQKSLRGVGLNISSGIKLFLSQVIVEQGIPFVPNKNSIEIRARWDKEVTNSLKNGRNFKTAKELHSSIKT